tara:strand:+ start:527 stop:898 length:372 start_codon:yes stop_codon:yes gene_type:complete
MAELTLTISGNINKSLQPKGDASLAGQDIIYYGVTSGNTPNEASSIVRLGECVSVNRTNNTIVVEVANSVVRPSQNDFIFFGKDNQASTSGILGYYAELEMKNNSTDKIELFSVGTEVFESSK